MHIICKYCNTSKYVIKSKAEVTHGSVTDFSMKLCDQCLAFWKVLDEIRQKFRSTYPGMATAVNDVDNIYIYIAGNLMNTQCRQFDDVLMGVGLQGPMRTPVLYAHGGRMYTVRVLITTHDELKYDNAKYLNNFKVLYKVSLYTMSLYKLCVNAVVAQSVDGYIHDLSRIPATCADNIIKKTIHGTANAWD
ncbi:hypothetical protein F-LCD7_0292 [Faustovirus]|nr:hypothetical protein F-LCD7_0292 [Faustovirus]